MQTLEMQVVTQTGRSLATRRWSLVRSASALFLAAALGAAAHADPGMTRTQVKEDLAEAIRTGNMLAPGESGLTLRELDPRRYPAAASPQVKSRAQVRTELADAIRSGDVMANDESGLKVNEEHPRNYPAQVAAAAKTRAEVKVELSEAIRTGDMLANDESGLMLNEEHPQRYAAAHPTQGRHFRLMSAKASTSADRTAQ
jgi:Domain of unknown function (DUF4148)